MGLFKLLFLTVSHWTVPRKPLACKKQETPSLLICNFLQGISLSCSVSSTTRALRAPCPLSYMAPAQQMFTGWMLLPPLPSRFSCVRLHVTPQMAAQQAPLSLGFSRQEYWSGLPLPSPMQACMLSRFSHVWLCVTLRTAAHQAPLSMGFSRQEYWSALPLPSPMGWMKGL